MNCDQVELLLAAYVEGALCADDTARIDAHVRSCSACGAALADYQKLEAMLLRRSELRPAPALTARNVAKRLGFAGKRRTPRVLALVPRAVAALSGLPGIVGASFMVAGILMLFFGDSARSLISRVGGEFLERLPVALDRLPLAIDRLTRTLDASTGGHEWVPAAVFLGVFLAIASAGSWMVMRFVREP
ncbi:MAG: anti-sigma factor family protein [Candidatus Krumholzibacteriia bacterium]